VSYELLNTTAKGVNPAWEDRGRSQYLELTTNTLGILCNVPIGGLWQNGRKRRTISYLFAALSFHHQKCAKFFFGRSSFPPSWKLTKRSKHPNQSGWRGRHSLCLPHHSTPAASLSWRMQHLNLFENFLLAEGEMSEPPSIDEEWTPWLKAESRAGCLSTRSLCR